MASQSSKQTPSQPHPFEWLIVTYAAALVPSCIFLVMVAAGVTEINLRSAVLSASVVYIPSAIYLSVWGDILLYERWPHRWRVLLGFFLFVVLISVLTAGIAFGAIHGHTTVPSEHELLGSGLTSEDLIWVGFQLVVAAMVLLHAVFEKSAFSLPPASDGDSMSGRESDSPNNSGKGPKKCLIMWW